MGYTLSKTAPSKGDPTAKNRVWDFFDEPTKPRPENRRQPLQPRRKNRACSYKTASGIPYWPSRDPIEERGGLNLYGFCYNSPWSWFDVLGEYPDSVTMSIPALAAGSGMTAAELAEFANISMQAARAAIALAALKITCDQYAQAVRDAKDDPNLIKCKDCDSDITLALKITAWEALATARWIQNQACSVFLKSQRDIDEHIKKQQEAWDNWKKCLAMLAK